MSFFKDFKDDLSAAVDELMPGGDLEIDQSTDQDLVIDTFANDNRSGADLGQIDELLEKVETPVEPRVQQSVAAAAPQEAVMNPVPQPQPQILPQGFTTLEKEENLPISDETTVITAGTVIHGDIESTGSLDISGEIAGDVKCRGKLTVTGTITGNSHAEEVFADSARIAGEIVSNGTVKIGLGSVIVGNVTANSAVVAGAIKGDIDVHGPVVVDTSAVVMGNIKSRSVQINNGAVIEGFCSQAYADIDVDSLFGGKKA